LKDRSVSSRIEIDPYTGKYLAVERAA